MDIGSWIQTIDWTWLQFVPIAAVVSALVTLLIRYADRPRPVIVIESQMETRSDELGGSWEQSGYERGILAITNVGDGDAYEFEVFGDNCDAAMVEPKLKPQLSPRWVNKRASLAAGETALVWNLFSRDDVQAGTSNARLVIRWNPHPGRPWSAATRQVRQVRLTQLASSVPFPVGMFEPTALPKTFRKWRNLERYTERGRIRNPEYQRAQSQEEPQSEE